MYSFAPVIRLRNDTTSLRIAKIQTKYRNRIMRKTPKTIRTSEARQLRVKKFTEIFIQEYLLKYRPEVIIKEISEKYIIPEQTIRDYIKPAILKQECQKGKHHIDNDYVSIIKI